MFHNNSPPLGRGGNPPPNPWTTATFVAIFVMILATPMIFNHGSNYLHPFVIGQWGLELGEFAFWGAWLVILPALFSMLRSSLNSSIGLAGVWILERFIF